MEFYKNAIRMRTEISKWMMRGFGVKRNPKSVNQVIKDISEEDQQIIDDIFAKYSRAPNHEFQTEFPQWFVEQERKAMMDYLKGLIDNITLANSIYPSKEFLHEEYATRRKYQNNAIGICYNLYQELQYIASCFAIDLNRLIPFLEMVEKEIELLKGWKQSDNQKRKNIEKGK